MKSYFVYVLVIFKHPLVLMERERTDVVSNTFNSHILISSIVYNFIQSYFIFLRVEQSNFYSRLNLGDCLLFLIFTGLLLIYDWKGNKAPSSIRRKIVQGNIFHPKPNFGGEVRHLFSRFQFRLRCIKNVTQASWYDYGKFSYLTKILRNWCSLIKVHVKQLVRSPTS